jgi:F-type H+-transporting ATPase subunit a
VRLPTTDTTSGAAKKIYYLIGVREWDSVKFLTRNTYFLTKSILKSNTALKRKEYFSVLMFLFIFIFFSNLFGLIPYTFTLTSSFIVTFFLAATHFIGINIIGIYRQK